MEALGPVLLVRAGGLVAAAGFATALLAEQPVVGILGFACLGAGMSTVVPIVFRAAGAVPGLAAGLGLAAVSSMSYLGFLVGPPLIGGVAELTGLPRALLLLVGLAVAIVVLAPVTRPRAVAARAARPVEAAA